MTRGIFTAAVLLISGLSAAQQPVRPGQNPAGGAQPGERPATANNQLNSRTQDQQIAALIAECNRGEVEVAKFAMPKLQSDEAKEFATMMIKDHTAAAEKFEKWAGTASPGGVGGTPAGERREPANAERPTTAAGQTTDGARQGNTAGFVNWSAIHQEIARESVAGAKEELGRYKGNEFDKAYLGHQVAAHMKTATELKVLAKHVSARLAPEIEEAQSTVQKHLKHVRDLMEEKKDERSDKK